MKKIMVMLAAFVAAVVVNAATVDWNYKITGVAGGSATEFNGYTAYLVDAEYFNGLESVTKDSITATGNNLGQATVTQTSSTGKGTKTYIFTSGAQQYSDASLVEGTTYNYYLVLMDATGENYYAQAYDYTARAATATPSLDAITLSKTKADVTSGMTAWSTGGGDVPEPTSGLLLLVGGALLALRRKQK